MFRSAKERVSTVDGECTAGPVNIPDLNMQRVRKCGGEAHNRLSTAYRTMSGTSVPNMERVAG